MKIFLALTGILIFFGLTANAQIRKFNLAFNPPENFLSKQINNLPANNKPTVLVELFTSEGCAACPPADRVLSQLENTQPNDDAEIITLALHVDYWNNLGWKDPFSAPLFSQRQMIYGQKFKISSIYTPQMIVDGTKQFVGNNLEKANKLIGESAKSPKARIELVVAGDKLKINISDIPAHESSSVFLAIAEDNLSTVVSGGENSGRKLEYASVVRELKSLGRVLPADHRFETETILQFQPGWKSENLKVVVFLQENQSRKILGTSKLLPNKNKSSASLKKL